MENPSETPTPRPRGRPRRYPPEMRERALRLIEEITHREGESHGVSARVASQLGIGKEAVRKWVREAGMGRPLPTPEQLQVLNLEREVAELRRANEILKAACQILAGDAVPRLPR
jgi:transposase